MNGQEYLRQISATSTQPKRATSGNGSESSFKRIFSSLYFKLIVGALGAFILIAMLGSIINGGSDALKNNCISLKLHIDNIMTSITNYQSAVKSSNLRSSSASLMSVLSNTSRDLTNYLTTNYGFKEDNPKSIDANISEEQKLEFDEREQILFNAKINGALDRYYAHQMAYEISYLISRETTILKSTSEQSLVGILNSSLSSLNNLYSNFNDFSEASK